MKFRLMLTIVIGFRQLSLQDKIAQVWNNFSNPKEGGLNGEE